MASWSAQEVGRRPQVLPRRYSSIFSTVQPSTSLEMAFRLPFQPPVKRMPVTTLPSRRKRISIGQTFWGIYVYSIGSLLCFGLFFPCMMPYPAFFVRNAKPAGPGSGPAGDAYA